MLIHDLRISIPILPDLYDIISSLLPWKDAYIFAIITGCRLRKQPIVTSHDITFGKISNILFGNERFYDGYERLQNDPNKDSILKEKRLEIDKFTFPDEPYIYSDARSDSYDGKISDWIGIGNRCIFTHSFYVDINILRSIYGMNVLESIKEREPHESSLIKSESEFERLYG